MAKHFGMIFNPNSMSLYAERYGKIKDNEWIFDINHIGNKFYIHPNSLHLLDLEEGDGRNGIAFMWPEIEREE